MMERNFDVSSGRRDTGGAQLSLVRIADCEVHLAA
jgi:hypothetical protein